VRAARRDSEATVPDLDPAAGEFELDLQLAVAAGEQEGAAAGRHGVAGDEGAAGLARVEDGAGAELGDLDLGLRAPTGEGSHQPRPLSARAGQSRVRASYQSPKTRSSVGWTIALTGRRTAVSGKSS